MIWNFPDIIEDSLEEKASNLHSLPHGTEAIYILSKKGFYIVLSLY